MLKCPKCKNDLKHFLEEDADKQVLKTFCEDCGFEGEGIFGVK